VNLRLLSQKLKFWESLMWEEPVKNLTCIVCPLGCSLTAEEGPPGPDGFPARTVTGNRCPRGAVYAQEEIRAPRRVLTATCVLLEAGAGGPRRLPVKTTVPCPREQIPALLADIYRLKVKLPVKAGDLLISNWQGLGIHVAAARSL
jgi:CxxC motif-containing protein